MAMGVKPVLIGGNAMCVIESEALEYLRGDVGAFLGRVCGERMQVSQAG
jgi:hypothetical protein